MHRLQELGPFQNVKMNLIDCKYASSCTVEVRLMEFASRNLVTTDTYKCTKSRYLVEMKLIFIRFPNSVELTKLGLKYYM